MKLIRIGSQLTVVCRDGHTVTKRNLDSETISKIKSLALEDKEEEALTILQGDSELIKKKEEAIKAIEKIKKSKVLVFKGQAAYWPEISELSLPKELVDKILEAEINNDAVRMETYKNFWTLMSLNPDEQCRKNLFWFLIRNDLLISRSGFFVAYRNVDTTNKVGVYTDHYSHKFSIKIGEIVTMDREKCNSNQNVTCAAGLHLGNSSFIKKNYFGSKGLVCLCNPADVTAVPRETDYGKLRTCAYLPIAFAEYDKGGNIVPYKESDGFECSYVPKIIYEGLMGTEEDSDYKLIIPELPALDRVKITNNLLELAKEAITKRVQ